LVTFFDKNRTENDHTFFLLFSPSLSCFTATIHLLSPLPVFLPPHHKKNTLSSTKTLTSLYITHLSFSFSVYLWQPHSFSLYQWRVLTFRTKIAT
jgi:hypothetical protein